MAFGHLQIMHIYKLQLQIYIKSICGFCAYSFSLLSRTTLPSVSAACSEQVLCILSRFTDAKPPECISYFNFINISTNHIWSLRYVPDNMSLAIYLALLAVYHDLICRFFTCGNIRLTNEYLAVYYMESYTTCNMHRHIVSISSLQYTSFWQLPCNISA